MTNGSKMTLILGEHLMHRMQSGQHLIDNTWKQHIIDKRVKTDAPNPLLIFSYLSSHTGIPIQCGLRHGPKWLRKPFAQKHGQSLSWPLRTSQNLSKTPRTSQVCVEDSKKGGVQMSPSIDKRPANNWQINARNMQSDAWESKELTHQKWAHNWQMATFSPRHRFPDLSII